jgi:hypothetical protein
MTIESPQLEFRIRSDATSHVSALADVWMPATTARIASEVHALHRLRDPTSVLEIRFRQGAGRRRR